MFRHSAISVIGIATVVVTVILNGQPSSMEFRDAMKGDSSQGHESHLPDLSKVGHPAFASPLASPIAMAGGNVFVVNTPSDTVDVIDSATREITARINVGIDPVSIAVRPDGKELWVSNHVSDSVSVIDNDPTSVTFLQIVATIQEIDPETKSTHFDETVGIAFASNGKAYVALSSENEIAVIDAQTRVVKKRLTIPAQDPRSGSEVHCRARQAAVRDSV